MTGISPILMVVSGAKPLSQDESMKMFQLLIDNGAVTDKVQLPGDTEVKNLNLIEVLREHISSTEKALVTSKRMLACLENPPAECAANFCLIKITKAYSSDAAIG